MVCKQLRRSVVVNKKLYVFDAMDLGNLVKSNTNLKVSSGTIIKKTEIKYQ